MSLANNIKHLRENKGLQQKQVAIEIGLGISHYNKIENGQREASVELLDKLAKLYGVSIDAIVHMEGEVPKEIVIEDKTTSEQMRLIQELDEKDKSIVFSMIDIMLTKKKLKTSFRKTLQHYNRKAGAIRLFCLYITVQISSRDFYTYLLVKAIQNLSHNILLLQLLGVLIFLFSFVQISL